MTKVDSTLCSHVSYTKQLYNFLHGVHPWSTYVTPFLLFAEGLLCVLIIKFISYTEIDWKAYMEQIEQIVKGERDYSLIKGGTGPLVYPAAHVYLYWILYQITNEGHNILLAQCLFGVLYVATIAIVIASYRRAEAPLYILPLVVLSKRLHSIFLLRLFNDCFVVFFLWAAIYFFQIRSYTMGSLIYSFGLGIKMSLLLSFPAIGIVLFLTRGIYGCLIQIWLIFQLQIVLATPFLSSNASGYFNKAFELSRQFNFKWTVNWRFIGEQIFLDPKFSIALLTGHLCTIMLFITTRWLSPTQRSFSDIIIDVLKCQQPSKTSQKATFDRTNPKFILTTILSANAVGLLFARSLHYQFYAYIALASPFLLWRAGLHPVLQYSLWALQEWAWNVYPSSVMSSIIVVSMQLFIVVSIWWGTRKDSMFDPDNSLKAKKLS